MNNSILFLLVFLCLNLTLSAQQIGLQAGLVLSDVKSPEITLPNGDVIEVNPALGFSINGYVELFKKNRVSLSLEPGYILKGANWSRAYQADLSDYRLKLHYLQFPILANLNTNGKFFIQLGPEISFLINANTNPDGFIVDDFYDETIEFSAIIGFGYKVNDRLSANIRYNRGLSKISSISFTDFNGFQERTENEYNCYAQLSLRYAFLSMK